MAGDTPERAAEVPVRNPWLLGSTWPLRSAPIRNCPHCFDARQFVIDAESAVRLGQNAQDVLNQLIEDLLGPHDVVCE